MRFKNLFLFMIITFVFTSCESGFEDMMGDAVNQSFIITYDANGGTGTVPVDNETYFPDELFTVKANTLTNGIYNFTGWNTKANGSGTTYVVLSTCPMGKSDIILYAQWATLPAVNTNTTSTGIAGTSSTWGGEVTSDGLATVTERGLCWSTSINPTIASSKVQVGTGTGTFTGTITGLTINTTYHVRAYAINSQGTVYGSDISFNSGWTFGTAMQGGTLFYNNGSGGGLVAGTTVGGYQWTNCTDSYILSTSWDVGTGQTNTNNIIALFVTMYSKTAGAATYCDNLSEGGQPDWFLPSEGELNVMYSNIVRGYGNWSSTHSGFAGGNYYVYEGVSGTATFATFTNGNVTPVRDF